MEMEKENFINYWHFLEVPLNSPLKDIKRAFVSKFEKIKNSLDKGENKYSKEDLKICINAYETLSNPYSRFLHNCEINGEEPPKDPDWDTYFSESGTSDEDLSEEKNESFLAWLVLKTKELSNQSTYFLGISSKLFILYIKEEERREKMKQRNKKVMHK